MSTQALNPHGPPLTIHQDPERAAREIRAHCAADASRWPDFAARMGRYASLLDEFLSLPALSLDARRIRRRDLIPWLRTLVKLKRLGRDEMMDFLRLLPMTFKELMDEWFETPLLRGLLGCAAIRGTHLGPQAAGTALNFLYHLSRFRGSHFPELPPQAWRERKEPQHRPGGLTPRQLRRRRAGRPRPAAALFALTLDSRPRLQAEQLVLGPSLEYLERASDAHKYGRASERPVLEAAPTESGLAIRAQYIPPGAGPAIQERIIAALRPLLPELESQVVESDFVAPERVYPDSLTLDSLVPRLTGRST